MVDVTSKGAPPMTHNYSNDALRFSSRCRCMDAMLHSYFPGLKKRFTTTYDVAMERTEIGKTFPDVADATAEI